MARHALPALLACLAIAEARILEVPLTRRAPEISKRSLGAYLENYLPYGGYFATVEVGTPPQLLHVVVSTTSSDTWLPNPDICDHGDFDETTSSSYDEIEDVDFTIDYGNASSASGFYFRDTLAISGIQIEGQTMASVADISPMGGAHYGVLGLGFDLGQSAVQSGGVPYKSFLQSLVDQQVISSRAYSLYLDKQDSQTGSILLGGYDTDKYIGDLTMVPLLVDKFGDVAGFELAWTSLSFTTSDGTWNVVADNLPISVLIDSSTTDLWLPSNMYSALTDLLDAEFYSDYPGTAFVSCDLLAREGQFTFGFSGDDGPIIAVPFSEIARPLYSENGAWATDSSGSPFCFLSIADAGNGNNATAIFGQSFMRSTYLVFDVDNKLLGMAQANVGSSASTLVEYMGEGRQSRIATLDSPTPTLTANPTVMPPNPPGANVIPTSLPSLLTSRTKFATSSVPTDATYLGYGVYAVETVGPAADPVAAALSQTLPTLFTTLAANTLAVYQSQSSSTPGPVPTSEISETSSGLSTGAIAGIAVGGALGGAIIIAMVVLLLLRRRRRQRAVGAVLETKSSVVSSPVSGSPATKPDSSVIISPINQTSSPYAERTSLVNHELDTPIECPRHELSALETQKHELSAEDSRHELSAIEMHEMSSLQQTWELPGDHSYKR